MEKLLSSRTCVSTLPQSYVLPPGERPEDFTTPAQIPFIDLSKAVGQDRANIVEQILQASKQFSCFQVINHGIPEELMSESLSVFTEFFQLPDEDKQHLYSDKSNERCKIYTSSHKFASESIHYWRDVLRHECNPLDECMDSWPHKPARYRKVIREYSARLRELGSRILDLIGEGLRLESTYFSNGLTADNNLVVNYYPPCPDPSLTLGVPSHCDPALLTLLLQGTVPGLQLLLDGKWLLVEARSDAFVVNLGHQFRIISNDKLKGSEHRAVTNANHARTTAAFFIKPSSDYPVKPAKALVSASDPPRFGAVSYQEFSKIFSDCNGDTVKIVDAIKIKS